MSPEPPTQKSPLLGPEPPQRRRTRPKRTVWVQQRFKQPPITGAVVDVMRGIGVRVVGLIGTLVLARLLTPHDFGIIAFGVTLLTFANFLADGGIGNGLIRRVDPPSRADLKALLAFQIALGTALALGIGVALFPFGELGKVTALMAISLPLTAVRAPGVILLERQLNYKPFALVEIVESSCYYGWAVVFVIYGWGVWRDWRARLSS